ncbi:unnamed protein product, partial [Hapterophycus canaliculatus]
WQAGPSRRRQNVADMFHERQHLMHCAMHALNNLFQESWADRPLMERLALELYDREATLRSESGMRRMLVNPFKSAVPLVGDYDISVVIEALKLRECRVSLHVIYNPRVRYSAFIAFFNLHVVSCGCPGR